MQYIHRTCACGEIVGIGKKDHDIFKGIFYAHADRFEPPVPVTSWEGVYDATVQGVACPQRYYYEKATTPTAIFYRNETVEKHVIRYEEDCLCLNIWAPKDAQNAPVLVYIHGGSYETGNCSTPGFSGIPYCQRGIVMVTINYRLNAFGGAIGDGHEGNYGVQDQLCALQWIQRNIEGFGGDPEKVTIMGESAGAMSVQNQVFNPQAKGLFRGAIMLSGGGVLPRAFSIKPKEIVADMWADMKKHFGVETIDQLKEIPAKDLYFAFNKVAASDARYKFPATPVADGKFIPDMPQVLAETGNVNNVPTIMSVLSEDMWPHTLFEAIQAWGLDMERNGKAPTYGMYFDRQIPGSDHGAYHGCDVKYSFETLDQSWRPYDEIDFRISRNMIDYFAAFVKTGVPQVEGLPVWEPLGKEQPKFMHFGDAECAMEEVPAERLAATEAKCKPFPGM